MTRKFKVIYYSSSPSYWIWDGKMGYWNRVDGDNVSGYTLESFLKTHPNVIEIGLFKNYYKKLL